MPEWLRRVPRIARTGLATTLVVTPLVACQFQPGPLPEAVPVESYAPDNCQPPNPTLGLSEKASNLLTILGAEELLSGIGSGRYILDYYQLGGGRPSKSRILVEGEGVTIDYDVTTPEAVLPRWVIYAQEQTQAPLAITILLERVSLPGEIFVETYQRTQVGYRPGIIPELRPTPGESGARGGFGTYGADREGILAMINSEAALMSNFSRDKDLLYPSRLPLCET
jgi:hypothetical protein